MKKLIPYLWKLAWVVGLLLLTIISFDIDKQIDSFSASSFNISPKFWANFLIHFIWGIYLSLICIKKWTFQINLPLLICVFLPCILFSLIIPISVVTSINVPLGGIWFVKVLASGFIEIVAGFTLMLSIFNRQTIEISTALVEK
ncbi:hypothetical protein DCE79_07625 [Lysinibacillus sp. 2017]|uniref:hypothetical protein n=1 Tax=unclassified Lysinibacillus TaxID=2636778 RepID=UPI000D52951B|nr:MULTISPECIES: hypothetical protein [unclassified Lysinibacillus]AWE07255.1 hypothetical protein DCE79_07625 [Lysinibacillus sp. 2017]TGN33312.1 hypothetical protein E4L99_14730 [Lysinibacillus sp. S2017]